MDYEFYPGISEAYEEPGKVYTSILDVINGLLGSECYEEEVMVLGEDSRENGTYYDTPTNRGTLNSYDDDWQESWEKLGL